MAGTSTRLLTVTCLLLSFGQASCSLWGAEEGAACQGEGPSMCSFPVWACVNLVVRISWVCHRYRRCLFVTS